METIKQVQPNATIFDFDNNDLGDIGAHILSEQLRDFKSLTEISLQFNHIDKKGAIELFSLKKLFYGLDILFHGNKITDMHEMNEIDQLFFIRQSKL